jgi:N-acetylmuramoyl-L-alanine amidase
MTYKRGSRGEVVKQIQKTLCGAGYHVGVIDGIFGQMTEDAVKAFQKSKGLKSDGVVGVATLARLGIAAMPQFIGLKKSKRYINKILVHCSATPEGEDLTVEQIRAEHKRQGWSDIGYHYVIYRNGSIHEGRDVNLQGAHCADGGGNVGSIGVCYIGGVEKRRPGVAYKDLKPKDTRTDAQKAALLSLLFDLRKMYPDAKIYGHRDFDRHGKTCPSYDARSEYSRLVF